MWNELFDKVYVINLPASADRRKHIRGNFKRAGIRDYDFFPATNGRNLDVGTLQAGEFAKFHDYRSRHLSAGEIGCYLSHVRVWLDMLSNGYRHALICEDDVRFRKDSLPQVAAAMQRLPADWTILHLHCNDARIKSEAESGSRRRYADGIYVGVDEHGGAVCYALSTTGAMFLLQQAFPISAPVDGVTCTLTRQTELHRRLPAIYQDKGFVLDPGACDHVPFKTTIDDRPEQWGSDGLVTDYRYYLDRIRAYLSNPKSIIDKLSGK